jgi:transposase InsO family protein
VVNHKKVQRIWREEGLRVPVRRRRKRVGSSTINPPAADAPNRVWAVDFQWDADENGRKIKIVHLVDEHTREAVAGMVEHRIPAKTLTGLLDQAVATRGYPAALRCDNGPEFISATLASWAAGHTGLLFIEPGTPWNNGYIESFNGRLRDECLNINSFWNLRHAQAVISIWRDEYNHIRRHSALGYLPPAEYAARFTT